MPDREHQPGVRLKRRVQARATTLTASLPELDLITRDLVAKPGVGCAVIAAAGSNGAAVVLSHGRPGDRPAPGPREFVSRAVRAQRALREPIDPVREPSLEDPAGGGHILYGVSAPIAVPHGLAVALCAGLVTEPQGAASDLLRVVDSYARLASLWLSQREGSTRLLSGEDKLTGCLAHAAFLDKLNHEIGCAERQGLDLVCCFVMVENLGNPAAGADLAAIGEALRGAIGDGESVGRYGRSQFIVVLPGTRHANGLRAAQRMCASIGAIDGGGFEASIGTAAWQRGTGADRLLGDADRALTAVRDKAHRRKTRAARAQGVR